MVLLAAPTIVSTKHKYTPENHPLQIPRCVGLSHVRILACVAVQTFWVDPVSLPCVRHYINRYVLERVL